MTKALTKQGMKIMASTGVQKITTAGKGVTAEIKSKEGKVTTEEFSHVIVAVGIVPNLENIGLEELGIERDQRSHKLGRAHAELQSLIRISYDVSCLKKRHTTIT